MATGTGRFRVATPRSGQSKVIPGCLGHREFPYRRPGAPGQQSLTLRLCVFPRGCIRGRFLIRQRRVAPRLLVSSVSVVPWPGGTRPRHPWVGGRLFAGRRPHPALRFAPLPSGWARDWFWCRALRATRFGAAAAVRRRPPGPRSTPGHPSAPGAPPGATAPRQRPHPRQPLTYPAAPAQGASRSSAIRPRPSTGPQPPRSPEQLKPPVCLLRGRDRDSVVSPRPQRSCHSSLSAIPPASARPGTSL
ncbi:hypothetical protein NDU88_004378 [Pleurodeles waltl]|uniref:Uncharacterized protein n=1 Tax=Pleurodeles waltl TaxID=8319 RepID=A0AAV7QF90_PLEWA|nr:hypothetical protein NDU88_004378 [Pleurodeles waltl]